MATVNAYVGNPYKLVFPLLSSGYLEINYDETVTPAGSSATVVSDARERKIWGHTGAFTLECMITPYDVNGSAKYKDDSNNNTEVGILDSTKTPPYPSDFNNNRATTYESTSILGTSNSALHTASPLKLMIFHNTNVQLYLENTTKNSYNQPAEYKIVAEFKKTGGDTIKLETDTVIKAENKLTGYYDSYGYYDGISTSYTNIGGADIAGQGGSNLTLGLGTPMNVYRLAKGTELFDSNLNSLGVIDGINYSNGVLTMSQPQTTSQSKVYIHQKKEALYLEQMYKISFVYLKHAAEIHLDNQLVASMSHAEPDVVIHPSDIRLCGSGTTSEQFYGELYEIAMSTNNTVNVSTTKSLSPSFSNILFYFRFGE